LYFVVKIVNFVILFFYENENFSVKIVSGKGNCFFRAPAILFETVSYYFVIMYLIADAETVLCCTEYTSH